MLCRFAKKMLNKQTKPWWLVYLFNNDTQCMQWYFISGDLFVIHGGGLVRKRPSKKLLGARRVVLFFFCKASWEFDRSKLWVLYIHLLIQKRTMNLRIIPGKLVYTLKFSPSGSLQKLLLTYHIPSIGIVSSVVTSYIHVTFMNHI